MIAFDEIVPAKAVFAGLHVTSKKQLLQELAEKASALFDLDRRMLFETLLERERLGSTGVGNGVAIPHGKVAKLPHVVGMFVTLSEPVDFDAVDDRHVDLIFLLLAPENAGADHLRALARVSRLLRDREHCEKLRGAETADAVHALINQPLATEAA